ncbi:MAG TPA: tyrosine-type recombinase/integrase [Mycobacterium sp.]|nr:tyrosine-type recombinase/integrase [Mycobacterium sp.]
MSDVDDTPKPVPAWVQAHGITDRDTGIAAARASRQPLIDAGANAFDGGQGFSTAVALLGGLVTRGIGLHEGAVAALGADNPFAAFTTEPKSERSRRTVPLSAPIVALLKVQRAAQAAERLHTGDQWTDNGLVFTTEFGRPVDPRNLLRAIEIAAGKAGVEDIGVHTLRHSAAVAWLESGVHIKAVADLLGHAGTPSRFQGLPQLVPQLG